MAAETVDLEPILVEALTKAVRHHGPEASEAAVLEEVNRRLTDACAEQSAGRKVVIQTFITRSSLTDGERKGTGALTMATSMAGDQAVNDSAVAATATVGEFRATSTCALVGY